MTFHQGRHFPTRSSSVACCDFSCGGRRLLLVVALCLLLSRPVMSLLSNTITPPKNIVVIGGGIQGTSVAYHLAQRLSSAASTTTATTTVTILEAKGMASAASGKGGGFMARSWGDGSPTQQLHEQSFDMYETMARDLGCESYRKLPVLSVSPGSSSGIPNQPHPPRVHALVPTWLDGQVGRISVMGEGDDTAQITPKEFVDKMMERAGNTINIVLGTCTGVVIESGSSEPGADRKVTGIRYQPRMEGEEGGGSEQNVKEQILPADCVIVSAGPWSCAVEDWFQGAIKLPMEGIKSTSIVWKQPEGIDVVDATALFCGEDNRFGTHLEVYPRPDGSVYICGIGGSDYISTEDLKKGAFREVCDANTARVDAAKQSFQAMSALYKDQGQLDRVQACMRPCAPDAMPYMGRIPGYEGAYCNCAHNCWGIAWAPACGQAISELVLDGASTSINLAPFDPARFTPDAQRGDRGRKKQGSNVGEQW